MMLRSGLSWIYIQRYAAGITAKRFFSSKNDTTRTTTTKAAIGFLGLGNMGLPMVTNLVSKSSHPVVAFDLNHGAIKQATAIAGLQIATSIENLMSTHSPSAIITMLPSDNAVKSVMNEIIQNDNASSLQTIIDCSTVSPTTSRYWYNTLSETNNGCLFVDAPVSGGVRGANDATLTFMVGTDETTLNDNTNMVQSLLSYMGSRIIPCGSCGSGAAVKLCNNLALAAQMVGICEAMNLGQALGVDPQILANVMNTSTAKSWSCEVNNPHPDVAAVIGSPASKDYVGGFGTKLMLKDLGLAVSAGKEAHVALPLSNMTKELYQMADLRGLGDKDFGVILQFLLGK